MNRFIAVTLTLAVVLSAVGFVPAFADESADRDGIVKINWSKLVGGVEPEVTVRITPTLLRFFASVASEATSGLPEAQGIHEVIDQTYEIRVTAFDDIENYQPLIPAVRSCVDGLKGQGWEQVVHVQDGREKDETVDVLILPSDGVIVGILILGVERDDVAVVNIVGEYDPVMLGKHVGQAIQLVRKGKIDLDALLDLDLEDLLEGPEGQKKNDEEDLSGQ